MKNFIAKIKKKNILEGMNSILIDKEGCIIDLEERKMEITRAE